MDQGGNYEGNFIDRKHEFAIDNVILWFYNKGISQKGLYCNSFGKYWIV
jgi:hypothetical protein